MKFSKQLSHNAVAEWRQWYLDYSFLKKFLRNYKTSKAPDLSVHTSLEEDVSLAQDADSPLSSPRPSWSVETPISPAVSMRVKDLRITAGSSSLPEKRETEELTQWRPNDVDLDVEQHTASPKQPVSASRNINLKSVKPLPLTDEESPKELTELTVEKSDHNGEKSFQELENQFVRYLEQEAQKVESFYVFLKRRLEINVDRLESKARESFSTNSAESAVLRNQFVEQFLEIAELQNFASLNRTGFEKILKKHDKVVGVDTKSVFLCRLENYSFYKAEELNPLRERIEQLYSALFWNYDLEQAKSELYGSVREMIIWERNTVWREMLQQERKVANITSRQFGGEITNTSGVLFEMKLIPLMVSIILLFAMLILPIFSKEYSAAHRCLAMVCFVGALWVTEAVPVYVTSLSIPFLSVILRCFLDSNGATLSAEDTARQVLASMGSSVIMLILGGYTLAAALSKHTIDKWLATKVLGRVHEPRLFLFLVMLLGTTLSMVLSNVAVPVLLFSVLRPVIIGLPPSSLPFIKCLILGVAFSGNIGGMTTPISSPQNAVAIEHLFSSHPIGFIEWSLASLPVCLFSLTAIHFVLIAWYRPSIDRLPMLPLHSIPWNKKQVLVMTTSFLTVLLWSFKPVENLLGSEGIIAIVPIVILFGTGVLNKEDFNSMPWNVIYLVAGGISLGAAVKSSQLLSIVVNSLESHLLSSNLWLVFVVFCMFTMACSLIVSHTVSAIVILPVLAEVGIHMGHVRLFVMGGALACSCSMALATSSFPNMCALHVESETGKRYIQMKDFLYLGTFSSVIAGVFLCTLQFGLFYFIGL
eukprot:jgi/Galph1/3450/GphlegSOOS_G2067.1